MKGCVSVLLLSCLLRVETKVMHDDVGTSGCSDTTGDEIYGLDGEEFWYADFVKGKGEMALPPFADPFTMADGAYQNAVGQQHVCKANLAVAIEAYKNPTPTIDPPHSSIYPRDDVELGQENTLICHVSGYFPPPVRVWWTKNNNNVTVGVRITRPYPSKDGTYYQTSSMTMTPEEGDVYSCSVEHRSLAETLTRIWEPEVSQPSVGPAVFCGLGLTLGLLGVATGTFFLIKGNECS